VNVTQAIYANDGRRAIEKTKRPPQRLWKRRSVEKSKSRLFHLAWKSRKERGIPTFHTEKIDDITATSSAAEAIKHSFHKFHGEAWSLFFMKWTQTSTPAAELTETFNMSSINICWARQKGAIKA